MTPEIAKKCAEQKVRGVNKRNPGFTCLCLLQTWDSLTIDKVLLVYVGFCQFFCGMGTTRVRLHRKPESLRNLRTRVGLRSSPVSTLIRWVASATVPMVRSSLTIDCSASVRFILNQAMCAFMRHENGFRY
jgi:hypothetical protein